MVEVMELRDAAWETAAGLTMHIGLTPLTLGKIIFTRRVRTGDKCRDVPLEEKWINGEAQALLRLAVGNRLVLPDHASEESIKSGLRGAEKKLGIRFLTEDGQVVAKLPDGMRINVDIFDEIMRAAAEATSFRQAIELAMTCDMFLAKSAAMAGSGHKCSMAHGLKEVGESIYLRTRMFLVAASIGEADISGDKKPYRDIKNWTDRWISDGLLGGCPEIFHHARIFARINTGLYSAEAAVLGRDVKYRPWMGEPPVDKVENFGREIRRKIVKETGIFAALRKTPIHIRFSYLDPQDQASLFTHMLQRGDIEVHRIGPRNPSSREISRVCEDIIIAESRKEETGEADFSPVLHALFVLQELTQHVRYEIFESLNTRIPAQAEMARFLTRAVREEKELTAVELPNGRASVSDIRGKIVSVSEAVASTRQPQLEEGIARGLAS
jgi:hypothetical protein